MLGWIVELSVSCVVYARIPRHYDSFMTFIKYLGSCVSTLHVPGNCRELHMLSCSDVHVQSRVACNV
jgi:hypothetical protein